MKTIRLLPVIAIVAFALLFTACKKDDDKPLTREQILTSGKWKVTAITVDPAINFNGVMITDFYNSAFYPDCVKDNFSTFNANGTVIDDEGPTKCSTSDPQNVSGTWVFNSDKTIITLTYRGESTSYNILEFTNNLIKTRYSEVIEGVQYNFTMTLSKF